MMKEEIHIRAPMYERQEPPTMTEGDLIDMHRGEETIAPLKNLVLSSELKKTLSPASSHNNLKSNNSGSKTLEIPNKIMQ